MKFRPVCIVWDFIRLLVMRKLLSELDWISQGCRQVPQAEGVSSVSVLVSTMRMWPQIGQGTR